MNRAVESDHLHIPPFLRKKETVDMSGSVFAVIKRICEYLLPSLAADLWWYPGLSSFFLGLVYLQCVFWTHVFLDPYVGAYLAEFYSGITGRTAAYCAEGHEIASFVWVVVLYGEVMACRMVPWKNATLVGTTAVYLVALVRGSEPTCSALGAGFAVAMGSYLGIVNICVFTAVCVPLVEAAMRRSLNSERLDKKPI